jgi:hypothetical protein
MDIATAQRGAHGKVRYAPPTPDHRRGAWVVAAVPHVAIKVKRMLPRVQQSRAGTIVVDDTPDIARDLEWILERYPMDIDAIGQARLTAQADLHRTKEEGVLAILNGHRLNSAVRTPAREPRPYQLESADLALTTGQTLVTDEVGLGKSMTGLLLLRAADALPALIVTLTHLPKQWINKELAATYPDLRGHIITRTKVYDPGSDVDVLAISYSKLAAWADYLAGTVKTVIFDEIQELRHADTDKYRAAGRIADAATYRLGLSATPVYNFGGEAYNIISVLAPDALGSREEFTREWGSDLTGGKIKVHDPKALGDFLRSEGLMIGHTREQVGRTLPQPVLAEQNVDADPAVYDQLAGDAVEMAKFVLDRANKVQDRWRQAGELDMRMRQATGIAKAPAVAGFCRMLLETGTPRLVLWGWHRAVYDIWCQQLADYHPVLYTGTETPTAKNKAVDQFLDGRSQVLIMSLRSGAGLDGLQMGCDVGVFGELDWSPQTHVQCIGRLARDGIDHAVQGYFCISDRGSDPPMAEMLDIKRMQNDPLVNPDHRALQPAPAATGTHIQALAESLIARAANSTAA